MIARAHQPAVVLGAVKTKPSAALRAGLDRPCARQHSHGVAGTEEWLHWGRTKEWS
jgi:hypothetical protein